MNQYPDFDQKLYDDLRRGKEYAFAAVFDRYHRLLYTIAYRFLKSEEEAEDAVQYLFMKLWEQRETFSFESGIRSLLFTILKNYILYLQPIITQYFIDNKSEIWLLFLIAHSKR